MENAFSKLRTHLQESYRTRVGKAYEAVRSAHLGSTLIGPTSALALVPRDPRADPSTPTDCPPTVAPGLPHMANPRRPCCNDPTAKAAEVRDTIARCSVEGTPLRGQIEELHRRGAFRHDYDVAYAVIILGREGRTVDALAVELDQSYVRSGHRCDPVYPPS